MQSGIAVALREPRLIRERTSLGETALHLLVFGDSSEAIRSILELGSDVNGVCNFGETPLPIAASRGHPGIVKLLLQAGGRVAVDGQYEPTLHKAVRSGNLESVEAIVVAGADVNQQADFAEAAVHIAAEENFVAILELLISRGADASIRSTFGGTALEVARESGSQACVELLSSRH